MGTKGPQPPFEHGFESQIRRFAELAKQRDRRLRFAFAAASVLPQGCVVVAMPNGPTVSVRPAPVPRAPMLPDNT